MSSWGDEVASSSADGAGSGAGAADARAALKAKVEKLEGTITRLREDIIAAAEDPSKIDKLDRQLTMHEAALTSTKEELAALGPAVDEVSESVIEKNPFSSPPPTIVSLHSPRFRLERVIFGDSRDG